MAKHWTSNHLNKDQKGFSLIEVMVVFGLLGLAMLTFSTLFDNSNKNIQRTSLIYTADNISINLRSLLVSQANWIKTKEKLAQLSGCTTASAACTFVGVPQVDPALAFTQILTIDNNGLSQVAFDSETMAYDDQGALVEKTSPKAAFTVSLSFYNSSQAFQGASAGAVVATPTDLAFTVNAKINYVGKVAFGGFNPERHGFKSLNPEGAIATAEVICTAMGAGWKWNGSCVPPTTTTGAEIPSNAYMVSQQLTSGPNSLLLDPTKSGGITSDDVLGCQTDNKAAHYCNPNECTYGSVPGRTPGSIAVAPATDESGNGGFVAQRGWMYNNQLCTSVYVSEDFMKTRLPPCSQVVAGSPCQ